MDPANPATPKCGQPGHVGRCVQSGIENEVARSTSGSLAAAFRLGPEAPLSRLAWAQPAEPSTIALAAALETRDPLWVTGGFFPSTRVLPAGPRSSSTMALIAALETRGPHRPASLPPKQWVRGASELLSSFRIFRSNATFSDRRIAELKSEAVFHSAARHGRSHGRRTTHSRLGRDTIRTGTVSRNPKDIMLYSPGVGCGSSTELDSLFEGSRGPKYSPSMQ